MLMNGWLTVTIVPGAEEDELVPAYVTSVVVP